MSPPLSLRVSMPHSHPLYSAEWDSHNLVGHLLYWHTKANPPCLNPQKASSYHSRAFLIRFPVCLLPRQWLFLHICNFILGPIHYCHIYQAKAHTVNPDNLLKSWSNGKFDARRCYWPIYCSIKVRATNFKPPVLSYRDLMGWNPHIHESYDQVLFG